LSYQVTPLSNRPPPVELPHCDLGDHARAAELMREHGVVVFKRVVDPDVLARGVHLFWDWLENTDPGQAVGISRLEPTSHKTQVWHQLGYANTGVMSKSSIGQSHFLWFCRQLPGVIAAWETLWGVSANELACSFDGCGSWRNCWLPHNGAGGSTVVLPGSHRDFEQNCLDKPKYGSFVRMSQAKDLDYCRARAVQAVLGPGDLIVWDSRVVHCSAGADSKATVQQAMPGREAEPLLRLVAYMAMLPRNLLASTVAGHNRVKTDRHSAVMRGVGTGHDPRRVRFNVHAARSYTPPEPNDPLWRLV